VRALASAERTETIDAGEYRRDWGIGEVVALPLWDSGDVYDGEEDEEEEGGVGGYFAE